MYNERDYVDFRKEHRKISLLSEVTRSGDIYFVLYFIKQNIAIVRDHTLYDLFLDQLRKFIP